MIVLLARGVARVVASILLPVLALAALVLAAASAAGGALTRDAASAVGLTDAWRSVGDALGGGELADAQTVAIVGAALLAAGLIVLIGVLVPTKDRDLPLQGDPDLAVRRGALRGAVQAQAKSVRGVPDAHVRVRARRLRRGGTARITATNGTRQPDGPIVEKVRSSIAPLTEAFGLRTRVRASNARRKGVI